MHAKVAKSTQIYYFQSLPDGLVGLLVRWAGGNLPVLPAPSGSSSFLASSSGPFLYPPSPPLHTSTWGESHAGSDRHHGYHSLLDRVFLSLLQLHGCTGSSFQLLSSRYSHLGTPASSSLPEGEECCSFSNFLQEKINVSVVC